MRRKFVSILNDTNWWKYFSAENISLHKDKTLMNIFFCEEYLFWMMKNNELTYFFQRSQLPTGKSIVEGNSILIQNVSFDFFSTTFYILIIGLFFLQTSFLTSPLYSSFMITKTSSFSFSSWRRSSSSTSLSGSWGPVCWK